MLMVCAQFMTAAHACPVIGGLASPASVAMAAMPGCVEGMTGDMTGDMSGAAEPTALCHAHCHQGQQNLSATSAQDASAAAVLLVACLDWRAVVLPAGVMLPGLHGAGGWRASPSGAAPAGPTRLILRI